MTTNPEAESWKVTAQHVAAFLDEARAENTRLREAAPAVEMHVWCVTCETVFNVNRRHTHDGHAVPGPGFRTCDGPFRSLLLGPEVQA